jgi:hypothetical protein
MNGAYGQAPDFPCFFNGNIDVRHFNTPGRAFGNFADWFHKIISREAMPLLKCKSFSTCIIQFYRLAREGSSQPEWLKNVALPKIP